MADFDVCTLGAATLNSETKVATCEVSREFGVDGDYEPIGTAPFLMALGLTALPMGPSNDGHAEGVIMSPCGPHNAAIVGATDTRCADVYGEMEPGDTCVHSTGSDSANRARLFCKNGNVALLVGNDVVFVMDRTNSVISLAGFGHSVEISAGNGVLLAESGGACIQMKGGAINAMTTGMTIAGACTLGDATAQPLAKMTALLAYMTALEAVLTAISAATTPATSAAVATFISSMASVKTAMATTYAKGT